MRINGYVCSIISTNLPPYNELVNMCRQFLLYINCMDFIIGNVQDKYASFDQRMRANVETRAEHIQQRNSRLTCFVSPNVTDMLSNIKIVYRWKAVSSITRTNSNSAACDGNIQRKERSEIKISSVAFIPTTKQTDTQRSQPYRFIEVNAKTQPYQQRLSALIVVGKTRCFYRSQKAISEAIDGRINKV